MEITSVASQQIAASSNVLFTETAIPGGHCITHREGSGLVNLRGLVNPCECYARFLVNFQGNVAIPEGGTPGEISLAIALDGEPIASSIMIVTPTVVESFFNISSSANIVLPEGDNVIIAIENTSDQPVTVQNANLIVTRTL